MSRVSNSKNLFHGGNGANMNVENGEGFCELLNVTTKYYICIPNQM